MRALNWNTNQEQAEEMRQRQQFLKSICLRNKAENWMSGILERTELKWTRQAVWGRRVFDFWNGEKGIAVEVDGPHHEQQRHYDLYRDEYNFRRSGIIVLRVANFDEVAASDALQIIFAETIHKDRKARIGIQGSGFNTRRILSSLPYPPSLLKKYLAGEWQNAGQAQRFALGFSN